MFRTVCAIWLSCLLAASLACGSPFSREVEEAFLARTGPVSVTVFPVHVVKGKDIEHDAGLARRLAAYIGNRGWARPAVSKGPVEVPVQWGRNQASMYKRSVAAFSEAVAASGIATDYALLVEILGNADEDWVGGVHVYLVDAAGTPVTGQLCNSHHPEFKEVDPKDREGGYRVALLLIKEILTDKP